MPKIKASQDASKGTDIFNPPEKNINCDNDIEELSSSTAAFESLPRKEVVAYYKQRLAQMEKDYEQLLENLNVCERSCFAEHELQKEIEKRNAEVAKLRILVSELQICIHQEREQLVQLMAENDTLQIKVAEDRSKISFLLSQCTMTEDEVTYVLNVHKHGIVPKVFEPKFQKSQNRKSHTSIGQLQSHEDTAAQPQRRGVSKMHNGKVPLQDTLNNFPFGCTNCFAKNTEYEDMIECLRNQVDVLTREREVYKQEWKGENGKLQDQIQFLSDRLSSKKDKMIKFVRDLAETKQFIRHTEHKWKIEKERLMQNLKICHERLGETCPSVPGFVVTGSGRSFRTKQELCGQVHFLKDELQAKDNLISAYQNKIVKLEEEISRHKEYLDVSRNKFQEKTQMLSGEVAYVNRKLEEIDRRRRLDAEGFRNDIKILRGTIKNIEKKALKQMIFQSVSPGTGDVSPRTSAAISKSQEVTQEIKNIKKKLHRIEAGLWNFQKNQ